MILEKIEKLLEEVKNLNASTPEEIEALRLKYLSKKGEINAIMADFRNVPAEQKKEVGVKINELKQTALNRINSLREQCDAKESHDEGLDLTRTAYPIKHGTRHPLTIVRNEIIDIFSRMGFTLADGPEVEDDLHVFTKMNFAADHPARDMQDTFFVETNPNDVTKNIILRSHTSSVQARVMDVTKTLTRTYRSQTLSKCCLRLPASCSVQTRKSVFVQAISRLPSRVPRWIFRATSAGARAAVSVSIRDGLKSSAAEWLTPMSLSFAA